MNRIHHFLQRQSSAAYHAPSILLERPEERPPAWRGPVLDVLSVVAVLALAAVMYLLLIWLSLDIVEPTALLHHDS